MQPRKIGRVHRTVHCAPGDVLFGARLTNQKFILGRSAGVLPGPAHHRAVGGDHALAAANGFLVERGRGQIPPGVGARNFFAGKRRGPLDTSAHWKSFNVWQDSDIDGIDESYSPLSAQSSHVRIEVECKQLPPGNVSNMSDHRPAHLLDGVSVPAADASVPARDRRPVAPVSADTEIAVDIRDLVAHGSMDAARERFAELVTIHQRRAMRIAYQYLHDAADADEVVQDAFLKVFSSYRLVSRGLALRGLVHPHSHQRLPRSPEGTAAACPLVRAGRYRLPRRRLAPGFQRQHSAGRSGIAAARPRAAGAACGGDRPPRRPAADYFHVDALRRLHAARSQRHDGPQGIDRARPPVSRGTQAAGLLGGKP